MSTSDSGLFARLRVGLGAQAFGQVLNLSIRLAEVPLFLAYWGADGYGEWLMVATIPSYLAMADGGFTDTTRREMTLRLGAGDRAGALAIFQSTWVLLIIISIAIATLGLATVFSAPIHEWLALKSMTGDTLPIVIFALLLHVLLCFQCSLVNGAHSCVGRYARGTVLTNVGYLLDFSGISLAIASGGGPLEASIGLLAGRTIGLAVFLADKTIVASWLHYGWEHASREQLSLILKPSLASMGFPLGEALNVQGMRLLVGLMLGPAALAVFSSTRTLCRSAMKPIVMISRLIEPEIALAYGAGRHEVVRILFLRGCQISLWAAIAACLSLWFVSDTLYLHWTSGKIQLDHPLLALLLISTVINSLWLTALMVPYATNRFSLIGPLYAFVFGIFVILLSAVLLSKFSLIGCGVALLAGEVVMVVIVTQRAAWLCGVSIRNWAKNLFKIPNYSTK